MPATSTPSESTATPQSIEGEPAMTTTKTVTAPNTGPESTPDEPSATENAHSAGTEQRETEHVDPAGSGSAHADTAEDSGREHRLVWLDPRGLAVHPRNIRDDLGDLSGLADSIAAQGVLEALTVIPHAAADGTPGHQIVAGHRRAAAAILAGVTAVPCVLRPDLALDGNAADGDRAAQAGHVGAMLAENLHRRGLSAVEEARGVQAMLDLGVSLTRVAKSTGLGRKRVAKAAGVARLDGDTAAAVADAGLTLDQAAAVAVYAGDPDTTAALVAAAGEGPGRFAHALTRAKQARQEAEKAAALLAELTAAGRTVLDEDTGRAATRLADLEHDGHPLTAHGHAGSPGSPVRLPGAVPRCGSSASAPPGSPVRPAPAPPLRLPGPAPPGSPRLPPLRLPAPPRSALASSAPAVAGRRQPLHLAQGSRRTSPFRRLGDPHRTVPCARCTNGRRTATAVALDASLGRRAPPGSFFRADSRDPCIRCNAGRALATVCASDAMRGADRGRRPGRVDLGRPRGAGEPTWPPGAGGPRSRSGSSIPRRRASGSPR